jgi:hypothetical protein
MLKAEESIEEEQRHNLTWTLAIDRERVEFGANTTDEGSLLYPFAWRWEDVRLGDEL